MGTAARSWEEYRRQRRALERAAAQAASGRIVEADPAAFRDPAALAAAAQSEWWHRLLGRIDGDVDDDLSGASVADCLETVRRAWARQRRDMAGHLLLAWTCPSHPRVRRDGLRYARLLALFAGLAEPHDPPLVAAAEGLALIGDLGGLTAPRPAAVGEARAGRRRWGHRTPVRHARGRSGHERLDPVA
jgi:hypothetical protein